MAAIIPGRNTETIRIYCKNALFSWSKGGKLNFTRLCVLFDLSGEIFAGNVNAKLWFMPSEGVNSSPPLYKVLAENEVSGGSQRFVLRKLCYSEPGC